MSDPLIGKLTGEVFDNIFHARDHDDHSIVILRGTKVLPGHVAITIIGDEHAVTVHLTPSEVEDMVARIAEATKETSS